MVLKIYKPTKSRIILPSLVKSIPLPPDTLEISPLKISVVAFPNILGPNILNITLPMANTITKKIPILY